MSVANHDKQRSRNITKYLRGNATTETYDVAIVHKFLTLELYKTWKLINIKSTINWLHKTIDISLVYFKSDLCYSQCLGYKSIAYDGQQK